MVYQMQRVDLLCAAVADGRSNSLLMEATQPHCSLKMNGDKLSALIITHTHLGTADPLLY